MESSDVSLYVISVYVCPVSNMQRRYVRQLMQRLWALLQWHSQVANLPNSYRQRKFNRGTQQKLQSLQNKGNLMLVTIS
jgi:hypothetical protein